MPNMEYCMFSNTLNDLQQCVDRLDELGYDLEQLSDSERKSAWKLLSLCKDVVWEAENNDVSGF